MEVTYPHFFEKAARLYKEQLPFVLIKKPFSKTILGLSQNDATLHELKDFNTKGFVMAPFFNAEKTILFPKDACQSFHTKFNQEEVDNKCNEPLNGATDLEKEAYLKLIDKAIQTLREEELRKVVLSRKETIQQENFDFLQSFQNLISYYPAAYVYVWFHPEIGVWMGASPEKFITCDQNHFKTIALAATQPFKGTTDVTWNKKEIEEQQMVTSFIKEQIETELKEFVFSNPYTIKAGGLLHIKTDISGDLKDKSALSRIIKKLHPTPAVCGVPKNLALDFIQNNEPYKRHFYGGFLGELDPSGKTELYVNIRCMSFWENQISMYIGGGVTAKSIAQNEWEETVQKSHTIKKAL